MTMVRWIGWAIALALLMAGGAASAARIDRPLSVCILRATPGMDARTLFREPGRFDCHTPQRDWGSGDYWVMSQPLPTLPSADGGLSAQTASLWQDRTTLHILYHDGTVRRAGFTRDDIGDHLLLGATFRQMMPTAASPPVRLLWHVEGAANTRGILLGARLRDCVTTAGWTTALAATYGAFVGLSIALIVYNLAMWGALRQRFQIVYCVLVLCLMGYAITSSGAILYAWPALDNNDRQRINIVLLGASAIAVMAFARAFFETRVFDGWLRRASDGAMAAVGIASLLILVAPADHLIAVDRLRTLSYVALVALLPSILWRAWRVRSAYLLLFALAWGLPIGFAGARIVQAIGLIGWSFWLDNSTVASMTVEALLSSLAIAYRIKLLSRERDEAREQEIAARLLADTDPLTGLLNRRAFLARVVERPGEQMLLIADIDHFKTVNETIGHDGGDEVLRIVARAIRAAVPPDALVARIGGEEFAIVVDVGAVTPADVLARLRAERMPFDLRVTASIGSCTGTIAREADWNALYRAADRALFAAKAAGRDRARRAHPIAA